MTNPTPRNIDPTALRTTLQALFPSADITPEVLAQVQQTIAGGAPKTAPGAADAFRYYMAVAAHSRAIGTTSSFVVDLPLVRFALPQSGDFAQNLVPTLKTAIGYLIPEDRLIASVEMVAELTGNAAARVDLLTPARAPGADGARFGAFATYLCYANTNDTHPSWYVVEAGTATGKPKVLFASDAMGWFTNRHLGYQPTPFSKETDYVSGLLTMSGDEPETLKLLVTDTSGVGPDANPTQPYVSVSVKYNLLPSPPHNNPVDLIIEAATRIGVIGAALHVNPGVAEVIASLVEGAALQWTKKPGM